MANAINPTTQNFSIPYLTLQEFKNAPTAIDISNLVYNSSDPDAQDSELTNAIGRASSWVDTYCNQILGATNETETQRARVRSDGTIRFHPRYSPVIALTSFSYGFYPTQLITAADCSVAWLEEQEVIFPFANQSLTFTSQGPIAFGGPGPGGSEVYLQFSYVNGYANDLIAVADAMDSSLTVESGVGITAGLQMKIYDGMYSETVIVDSSYVFGSTTVPLTRPLVYSHDPGVSISALPPAIKEATILAATAMLKVRGDNSMVMGVGTQPNSSFTDTQDISSDLGLAMDLLKPFRRIR